MTPQQIQSRVNQEAAARLPEVIERLFFLLEEDDHRYKMPPNVVWKWDQTGLLGGLDRAEKLTLAVLLDMKAHELIEQSSYPTKAIDEAYVVECFMEVKREFLRKNKIPPLDGCGSFRWM